MSGSEVKGREAGDFNLHRDTDPGVPTCPHLLLVTPWTRTNTREGGRVSDLVPTRTLGRD